MKRFEKYYGWIIAFVFCVAVIAVYKTFDNFNNITQYLAKIFDAVKPFFIAFIIAYILNIPAKRMQKWLSKSKKSFIKKHTLGISIITIYVLAIMAVLAILRMLIPALYKNIMDLYNNLPNYITSFQDYINNFEIIKKSSLFANGIDLYSEMNKIVTSIDMSQFGKYAQGVYNMTTGLFDIFVAVIASIYMLIDKERLKKGIFRLMGIFLKEKRANSITEHAKRINDIFTNYLYSRLMCSVIMAAMDMIPYFGSIISFVISLIVTFITGGVWKGVWTGVVLLVLQQIDGNLLGPKIMGNSLEIRPLWIIFAVTVGGALFGFMGMLFSVPVLAIIRAIMSDYFTAREMKKMSEESENNE